MNNAPSRRYQTAAAMAADLRRYLDGRPVLAQPITRAEKVWRWGRRNPLIATLTVVTALSLLALAIGGFVAASITSNLARSEKASRNKEQIRLSRGLADNGVLKLRLDDLRGLADLVQSVEPARNFAAELESRLTLADYWSRSHAGRLAQVFGMDKPIRHATLSPNGSYAATLDIDGNMRVWNCETGLPLTAAKKSLVDSDKLLRLQFSPDEKWLISIVQNGPRLATWDWQADSIRDLEANLQVFSRFPDTVFVVPGNNHILFFASTESIHATAIYEWDVESDRIDAKFAINAVNAKSVAFDPSGEMYGFGTTDGLVTVCDLETGSPRFSHDGHDGSIERLVFSPDKQWLASSSQDCVVRIWSIANEGQMGPSLVHDEDVKDMAFSPDGTLLVTASFDGSVRVWRTADSTQACPELAHHAPVLSIAFNHDGSLLAAGGFHSQVRLWSLPAGRPIDKPIPTVGTVRQLEFRQGTNQLLVLASTKDVHLWQVGTEPTPQQIVPQTDRVWSVDFSSDGHWLATASQDGRATVWSVDEGKPVFEPPVRGGDWELICTRLHPDQRRLLTLSKGSFFVQDLYAPDDPPFQSESKGFRFAQFSTDGRYAVLGSGEVAGVILFDFSERKYPFEQLTSPPQVGAVAIDQTATRCAAACPDGSVWIWKVADRSLVNHIADAHSDIVEAIAFSPDGQTVATAFRDKSIRLWNAADGSALEPVMWQQAPVQGLAFSPIGKLLAAAGSDSHAVMGPYVRIAVRRTISV